MKILFIYPDISTSSINFCPAIHILSAVLKREGCEVDMLHIHNEYGIPYDKDTIVKASQAKKYHLFAITSTSFNYKYANTIAGWLKNNGTLVILGGSHATIQPEDFKESNFDIFCVGEGEEPMLDLVRTLKAGGDWTKIPNFITRYSINKVRGYLRDLDFIPEWDFDITDTQKILDARGGWMSISFARGCPYECTFCINHLYKKIQLGPNDKLSGFIRKWSPERAISQLLSLSSRFNIKHFNLDDDLLTMDKKWMYSFTSMYKEKIFDVYHIDYIINARADTLKDDICQMLSESGCFEVRVGFETGNEKLRNELLDKHSSNEVLINAFKNLDKWNILSVAFAMIGLPGESWSTYDDTITMVVKLNPKLIRMTFLFPYKHTKIYDYCVEHDLFKGAEITDNRDFGSCLKFNLTDRELFFMRFLFPWWVNVYLFEDDEEIQKYADAIEEFESTEINNPEALMKEIVAKDKDLSKACNNPHYRYYSGNEYYFEYYDNLKNTISN